MLIAYSIREYTFKNAQGEDQKGSQWTPIGRAFTNKDGSVNVILDCYPLDGRIHIREPKEKDAPTPPPEPERPDPRARQDYDRRQRR